MLKTVLFWKTLGKQAVNFKLNNLIITYDIYNNTKY